MQEALRCAAQPDACRPGIRLSRKTLAASIPSHLLRGGTGLASIPGKDLPSLADDSSLPPRAPSRLWTAPFAGGSRSSTPLGSNPPRVFCGNCGFCGFGGRVFGPEKPILKIIVSKIRKKTEKTVDFPAPLLLFAPSGRDRGSKGSAGCDPTLCGHRRDAGATRRQERAGALPAALAENPRVAHPLPRGLGARDKRATRATRTGGARQRWRKRNPNASPAGCRRRRRRGPGACAAPS